MLAWQNSRKSQDGRVKDLYVLVCGVGLHPGLIESLVGEQLDTQTAFSTQPANYPSCVSDLLLCSKSPGDAETLNKS